MIRGVLIRAVIRPPVLSALSKGGGAPWRAFGGAALRVGGMTLRVLSKPLVVEPAQ